MPIGSVWEDVWGESWAEGTWADVEEVLPFSGTPLVYPVVLPDFVSSFRVPEMSISGFEIWEERILSDADTRVLSDGDVRVIADSSLADVRAQIVPVTLPTFVIPVEIP